MKNCGCLNKLADGGRVQEPYLTPLGATLRDIPALLRAKMSADSAGQDTDEYDARLQQAINSGRFRPVTGGRRDPELNASANVSPLQVARGWLAGLAGIPGDVESLGRLVNNLMTPKSSGYREMDPHPVLPTSDFYEEWLPGRDQSAAGHAASTLGVFTGGLGAPKLARGVQNVTAPVAKRTLATIDAGMRGHGPLRHVVAPSAPAYAMKPRGGNWTEISDDTLGGWIPENAKPGDNPVHDWSMKNLRNYITRDLGTATDPMLDVEREFPNMHFGEDGPPIPQEEIDRLYDWRRGLTNYRPDSVVGRRQIDTATQYLNKHDELSGGAPLTRWGRLSDSQILPSTAGGALAEDLMGKWPLGVHYPEGIHEMDPIGGLLSHTDTMIDRFSRPGSTGRIGYQADALRNYRQQIVDAQANDWRAKKPDAPVYSLIGSARDDLGLGHIVDYLEAATEPYTHARHAIQGIDEVDEVAPRLVREYAHDLLHGRMEGGLDDAQLQRWRNLHNAGLLLEPEALSRLSVPDAARKAIQWNRMMSEAAVAEDAPLQKGWKVHKDYGPEGNGMRWVEFGKPETQFTADTLPSGYRLVQKRSGSGALKPNVDYWDVQSEKPGTSPMAWTGNPGDSPEEVLSRFSKWHNASGLREGLSAEGDAMGHCVGGYCDDVISRGTKIYSLRDAKGRPHVTVEVTPKSGWRDLRGLRNDPNLVRLRDITDDAQLQAIVNSQHEAGLPASAEKRLDQLRALDYYYHPGMSQWISPEHLADPLHDIVQIKGKGNAAPVADYLPYVQDFVKSGKWGRVGDLRNTGLVEYKGGKTRFRTGRSQPGMLDLRGSPVPEYDMPSGYMTPNEAADFLIKQGAPEDWARQHVGDYETLMRRGYAHGGSVKADPNADGPGFLPRDIEETVDYLERLYAAAAELDA